VVIFTLESQSAAHQSGVRIAVSPTREASRQSKLDFLFVFSVATAKG